MCIVINVHVHVRVYTHGRECRYNEITHTYTYAASVLTYICIQCTCACTRLLAWNQALPLPRHNNAVLLHGRGVPGSRLHVSLLLSSLQGPFATFDVWQDYAGCEWTGLKFSNDGKRILISTNIAQLKLVDAFQGHELNTLSVKYFNNEKLCYICMHVCLCMSF